MESESTEFRKIEDRCNELKTWILMHAPQCAIEERHLVEGTDSRGYWAHGYLTALQDVLRLFSREIPTQRYGGGDSLGSRYAA